MILERLGFINYRIIEVIKDSISPLKELCLELSKVDNSALNIAKQSVKIGARALWLQFGIKNYEAKEIVESENITYISNKCIKQEYQKLFLKISPVLPMLKID